MISRHRGGGGRRGRGVGVLVFFVVFFVPALSFAFSSFCSFYFRLLVLTLEEYKITLKSRVPKQLIFTIDHSKVVFLLQFLFVCSTCFRWSAVLCHSMSLNPYPLSLQCCVPLLCILWYLQSSLSAWSIFASLLPNVCPVKIQIRLRECAVWSESSLGKYVRGYVF